MLPFHTPPSPQINVPCAPPLQVSCTSALKQFSLHAHKRTCMARMLACMQLRIYISTYIRQQKSWVFCDKQEVINLFREQKTFVPIHVTVLQYGVNYPSIIELSIPILFCGSEQHEEPTFWLWMQASSIWPTSGVDSYSDRRFEFPLRTCYIL